MRYLICYLIIINALGFAFMLADKQKAIKNKWRIPEATLLGVSLLGGSLGCFLGMQIFRHKTRKPLFFLGIPTMLVLQILLLVFMYTK